MSDYTDGLREIADLLDAIPDLPDPWFNGNEVRFSCWGIDGKDPAPEVRRIAKLIGGRWHKNDPTAGRYDASYYTLTHDRKFGPFSLVVIAEREKVCVRKQVGVERVEHEAVEAHVEEKPLYEWECVPLLAKVDELASAKPALEAVAL